MSADSVRLINTAIVRCNGNVIDSVDDGSKEAALFDLNYEVLVEEALCRSSWKFARKEELLVADPDEPIESNWAFALAMPASSLMLRTIIKDGEHIDYQLGADENGDEFILCNEDEGVYATFTYRADEDKWPPRFYEGVVLLCEEVLLKADERYAEAKLRGEQAEAKFSKAARTHAQEDHPRDPFANNYDLIAARRVGSAPRRQ